MVTPPEHLDLAGRPIGTAEAGRIWDCLRREGSAVIPGVLGPAAIHRLRDLCEQCLIGDRRQPRSQGSMIPVGKDPGFAPLIALPAVIDLLGRWSSRPTFTDGYVISKPPGGPRLFWHLDWYSWEEEISYGERPPQLGAMWYLGDTCRDNGCLRVIPGSHRAHHPLHDQLVDGHRVLGNAESWDHPGFADAEGEVDVAVSAGDLVLADARLLHAAHANRSPARRSMVTLWYQLDYAQFSPSLRATMGRKTNDVSAWPEAARRLVDPLLVPEAEGEPGPRTSYPHEGRRMMPWSAGRTAS